MANTNLLKNTGEGSSFGKDATTEQVAGGAADVIGSLGTAFSGYMKIKENLDAVDDIDEKGNTIGRKDTLGNSIAGVQAGAAIGKNFGAVGTLIGGAIGGLGGLFSSIFKKGPELEEQIAARKSYDLQTSMKAIRSEDTFTQQEAMAKNGLNVTGRKVVEAEKDELVLRKHGNVFKQVGDFQGGKPHELGGEKYVAEEGDIIIPGKHRKKVQTMLKNKRWRALESFRRSLPTDVGQKEFEEGTKGVKATKKSAAARRAELKRKQIRSKFNEFLAKPGVKDKIIKISEKHGFSPERLLSLIYFETDGSMSPSQKTGWKTYKEDTGKHKKGDYILDANGNKQRISSATGLIQFMKATAKELGTTVEALEKMSVLEQLDWVEKYYDKHHKFGDDPYDTVMASGAKNWDVDHIIYKKGSEDAEANPSWQDENGNVTKASARKAVPNYLPDFKVADVIPGATSIDDTGEQDYMDPVSDANKTVSTIDEQPGGYREFTEYEKYVRDSKIAGVKPKSEQWFNDNVQVHRDEQARGFWTADSPTGQRAMKDLKARMEKAEEADSFDFMRGVGSIGTMGITSGGATGLAASRETFGGLTGDVTQVSGFFDTPEGRRTKSEAEAFYQYLQHDADITWMPGDALRRFDELRAGALGADNTLGPKLADAMSSLDADELEKLIKDASDKGVIGQSGSAYLWELGINPQAQRSIQHEVGVGMDIAGAVANAPGMFKMLGKSGKLLWKGGKLTVKGARAFLKSSNLKKMMKAAKDDPAQARKLRLILDEYTTNANKFTGEETLDDLLKAADELENTLGQEWVTKLPSWNNMVQSARKLKPYLMVLPDRARKAMTGMSFTEKANTIKALEKATGLTPQQLKGMTKAELGMAYKKGLQGRLDAIEQATKSKDAAWKNYHKVKAEHTDLQQQLKALEDGKASPTELAAVNKKIEQNLNKSRELIDEMGRISQREKQAYAEIDRLEGFMSDDLYKDQWRTVQKLNDGVERQMLKLDDADEARKIFKDEIINTKTALKGLQNESAAVRQKAISGHVLRVNQAAAKQADALADGRNANLAVGREKGKLAEFNARFANAPRLAAQLENDAEAVDLIARAGKGSLRAYNALKKKYPDIEPIEQVFPDMPKDQKEPTKIDGLTEEEAKELEELSTQKPIDILKAPAGEIEIDKPDQGLVTDPEYADGPTFGQKLKYGINKAADVMGDTLSNLAAYAPAVYNIAKGMQPAEKVKRNFIQPQLHRYEKMNQAELNAIDNAFSGAMATARNLSGGSMANYRSNVEKAWADKLQRESESRTREVGRADAIARGNIDILNQAEQFNQQVASKADVMDMQSEAATRSFLAQGMQDLANISGVRRKDKQASQMQDMMINAMNAGRPVQFDPKTGKFTIGQQPQTAQVGSGNTGSSQTTGTTPAQSAKVPTGADPFASNRREDGSILSVGNITSIGNKAVKQRQEEKAAEAANALWTPESEDVEDALR